MTGLDLGEVLARLHAAPSWWAVTSGPDGPHAVPVWGVVVEGRPCFYGEDSTVRSRNLDHDPRLVLHLESADDVLVLHATAHRDGPAGGRPGVNAAYAAKYTDPTDLPYLPDAELNADAVLWAVRPQRALAWRLGGDDSMVVRRWRA